MRASAMIRDRVVLFAVGAGLCGAASPAIRNNVPREKQEQKREQKQGQEKEDQKQEEPKADQKAGSPQDQDNATNFSDADAARVLGELGQALESNNERLLLKLFDAARMPDYPVFRDQVAQFFDEYEAFQVHYQITQALTEGRIGVAMVDFELEARPSRGSTPNVRRDVQLRLVMAWDGKQWRIVDLAPRSLFR
jgi:hypothetical protein